MRANVFTDPALAKLAGRFVWLSIETEKPTGEAFLEKFPMEAWPTLFVIDALSEKVELKWMGSGNVQQIEKLLDDGEYAVHRAWAQGGAAAHSPEDELADADRVDAAGQHAEAARRYGELFTKAPADWPRRARTAESWVTALSGAKDFPACASTALSVAASLPRGPSFANVAQIGLFCAEEQPKEAPGRGAALDATTNLAQEALGLPGLLADDRSGLYETLVDVRVDRGDASGARALAGQWWDFLAAEAERTPTPAARSALDAHRMLAASKAGDPARALPALEASERDLPEDYNAPARIAAVDLELGRYDDGLNAIQRALSKVYGPRRLRVLLTEAELYQRKGDAPRAQQTLEATLAEAEALPRAQRPEGLIRKIRSMAHPDAAR